MAPGDEVLREHPRHQKPDAGFKWRAKTAAVPGGAAAFAEACRSMVRRDSGELLWCLWTGSSAVQEDQRSR